MQSAPNLNTLALFVVVERLAPNPTFLCIGWPFTSAITPDQCDFPTWWLCYIFLKKYQLTPDLSLFAHWLDLHWYDRPPDPRGLLGWWLCKKKKLEHWCGLPSTPAL